MLKSVGVTHKLNRLALEGATRNAVDSDHLSGSLYHYPTEVQLDFTAAIYLQSISEKSSVTTYPGP